MQDLSCRSALLVVVLLVCACTRLPRPAAEIEWRSTSTATIQCLRRFASADEIIGRTKIADAQANRINGFPFLRANRFLASFADELDQQAKRRAWLEHLARLDREARQIEMRNMPLHDQKQLDRRTLVHELDQCRTSLVEDLLNNDKLFSELLERTHVADEYRTWQRALGLYPLSSLFVLQGIRALHASLTSDFTKTAAMLESSGERIFYAIGEPPEHDSGTAAWRPVIKDPLGIPEIDAPTRARLLRRYAPVWAVDTVSEHDRIGTPAWSNRLLILRIDEPRIYTHISFTRFQRQVLPQLNYTIWFPARPKTGPFDLLGGSLDGITWRVTLDSDGLPLIFDAMHNCGCYHQFFPTQRMQLQSPEHTDGEPLWVPKTLSRPLPHPLTIYVAHGTHYLENVAEPVTETAPVSLQLTAYDDLRSLPAGGATRGSLFAPNGIVPGTERAERWILWPMGVSSPGAMRQWGRHATAFVGRRHFDDAYLLDEYFERVD